MIKRWILLLAPLVAIPITAVARVAASNDTWPISRGDTALSGTTPARPPDNPVLRWRYEAKAKLLAAPVVQTGTVYIATVDGTVSALGLQDGRPRWTTQVEFGIEASPLLADGMLYVGDLDGRLYALDSVTGQRRWLYATEGAIMGGPNWWHGKRPLVLVGSYDNRLHAVDAATGEKVWLYETQNYVNGIPAVGDGVALAGGCDECVHVVALSNGAARVVIAAGSYVASSPAVRGHQAYVGHYQGEVLGLDIDCGTVDWRFRPEGEPTFYASVAATATRVVAASRKDGVVYCLSRTDGAAIWTYTAAGGIDSSPVIAGDRVLFGSQDGRITMLRFDTGEKIWSYLIGSPIRAAVAVVDGWIIAVAVDGGVYAFGKEP